MGKKSIAVYLSGKKPTLRELINDVIEVKENEHSFSIWSVTFKNDKKRINKQIFSKPEYIYVISEGAQI